MVPDGNQQSGRDRAAVDHANEAELRANRQSLLRNIRASRPKNTKLTYDPKQKKFTEVPLLEEFCARKQYSDGDTVTEAKLLLFLREVSERPLKRPTYRAGSDVPLSQTKLTCHQEANQHPSPREATVRQFIKSLQRQYAQRDWEQYADKGRNTLLDGYNEAEFAGACKGLWAQGTTSPEGHFRTLVNLLLGHYMLTRGEDRRRAELSDFQTFEFEGEGPTRCLPLIFTTRAGKENQFGHLETIGAMRNKEPVVCMLSGLAFYLLRRWDVGGEPFPDFSHRSSWYGIRLLKRLVGDNVQGQLSYDAQREWVGKAFGYAGITSQKKTHIGRSSGARLAEVKGVSQERIPR
ncbi:centromere DNA-binding protein complex CBF3 subunit [Penicillium sp. DV-2018c]|nr:centromere DNA-binding protein complex CBF3 subunit [Penicillium sp. DV-2018c]